jgi:hypothetical protein
LRAAALVTALKRRKSPSKREFGGVRQYVWSRTLCKRVPGYSSASKVIALQRLATNRSTTIERNA